MIIKNKKTFLICLAVSFGAFLVYLLFSEISKYDKTDITWVIANLIFFVSLIASILCGSLSLLLPLATGTWRLTGQLAFYNPIWMLCYFLVRLTLTITVFGFCLCFFVMIPCLFALFSWLKYRKQLI